MMMEEEDCGGQREIEDEVVVVEVSQDGQRWWKEFVMEVVVVEKVGYGGDGGACDLEKKEGKEK